MKKRDKNKTKDFKIWSIPIILLPALSESLIDNFPNNVTQSRKLSITKDVTQSRKLSITKEKFSLLFTFSWIIIMVLFFTLALIEIPLASATTISNCTTLSPSGYYELNQSVHNNITCMTITADNVELDCKGYTITYGWAGDNTRIGVDATDSSNTHTNLTVRNCIINKNVTGGTTGYGIRLTRFSSSNIINNTIRTNGTDSNYGIYLLTNSQNNNITNNTIETNGNSTDNYGIRITTSTGNKIHNNNITTGGTRVNLGIYIVTSANNNEVAYNNITTKTTLGLGTTTTTDNIGIYISGGSSNNLTGNQISTSGNTTGTSTNNYGIYMISSSNNNIALYNNIATNGLAANRGFSLSTSSNNNLSYNTISTNGTSSNYGIIAESSSSNNDILHNTIVTGETAGSNVGVYITASTNSRILNNTIKTNGTSSNYGVYLVTNANYNDVVNNTITTTGSSSTNIGIAVVTSTDNNISYNFIATNGTSNNYGLYVATTALRNNLRHNTIATNGTSSTNYGIYILESANNKAYNNTIRTNGTSANRGISISQNADNNDIANNTISTDGSSSSNYGIIVQTTSINNTIRGNVITTNGTSSNYGVYISVSSNNRFENNVVNTSGSSTANYGFIIDSNSQNNVIHNNTISTSGGSSDAFLLDASAPNFPHNNNISSNVFGVINRYHILFNDASINGTYLIDQYIANYSFTGIGSMINVKSTDYGVISFTNMTMGTSTNLSKNIFIRENLVYVNGSVSGLNRTANITIYNRSTTLTKLTIYRDGVTCSAPMCNNLTSMQAGNVTFNVTSWSQFSINNSDPLPPVITLDLINDGINTSSQNITFNFTVTDETSQNLSCDLMIDNAVTTTNLTITNNSFVNLIGTNIAANNHSWDIRCFDEGNNTNSSSTRSFFVDIYGPNITNIWYSPNNSASLDPFQNLTFNATAIDNRVSVDSVLLQYHNGTGWRNATMSLPSNNRYNASLLLISSEANYTFNIWANDTLGNTNQSVNQTFSALWDCNWNVSTSDLGETAGFAQIKQIGNLTINNTGDVLYPNNNCSLSFSFTYNLASGRIYIEGSSLKPSSSYTISANANRSFLIEASFLSEVKSESVTITTNEVTSGSGISETPTRNTSATIVSTQGGPYLFQKITSSPPSTVNLTRNNYSLDSYIRNLLGDDTVNNTAYNVSFNWTFPNSNFLFQGNASRTYVNLSNSSLLYNYMNLSFNETNLPNLAPQTYSLYLYAQGKNSTGSLIVHSDNQTLLTEQLNLTFSCYETSDSIAVTECGTLDPDNPIASTTATTTGGGGGGGGAPKEKTELVKTQADFQLVRGKQNEIKIKFKNKYENVSLRNIEFEVIGNIAKYIEITPSSLQELPPQQSIQIILRITSPTYIELGRQEITLYIRGQLPDAKYSETKKITIEIHELTEEEAKELFHLSKELINKFNTANQCQEIECGPELDESISNTLSNLLKEIETALSTFNYEKIAENYLTIKEIAQSAIETKTTIGQLTLLIQQAKEKGIDVSGSERILKLALLSLERREFKQALERIKEAQVTYALEVKGELASLSYYLKTNKKEISLATIFLALFSFTTYKLTRLRLLNKKIKQLKEEETILYELIKVVQKETFKEKRMSIEEYQEALLQYEKKLSDTIEQLIHLENQKAHALKFSSKQKKLNNERQNIIQLIKQLQEDYLKKGKIETRSYELKLESYNRRLGQIDQALASLEAKSALGSKWNPIRLFKK